MPGREIKQKGLQSDGGWPLVLSTWRLHSGPQAQPPPRGHWYLLRTGMASRILDGVTRLPLPWTLGLHVSAANVSVHIAIRWLLAQDASLSPRWCTPSGLWPIRIPRRRFTVSSPLPPLSDKAVSLTLHSPCGLQPQLMTCKPVSSVSLPPEHQAARTYCLLDAFSGPSPTWTHQVHSMVKCVVFRSKTTPLPGTRHHPSAHAPAQGHLPAPSSQPPVVTKFCHVHLPNRARACLLFCSSSGTASSVSCSCTRSPHAGQSGLSGKQLLSCSIAFSGSLLP